MRVSLIVALDRRGLIGTGAGLPWHLPADLRRFRALTWGKPIIMGRRTFASIGKPLPGRFNIVLTHDPQYTAAGCHVARSFPEALSVADSRLAGTGQDEAMIIGGGRVYAEAVRCWDRLYLTVVHGRFQGTTYFPLRELLRQKWRPACAPETFPPDERNASGHSFVLLERAWDLERGSPQPPEPPGAATEEALDGIDLVAVLARGSLGG